MIIIIINTTTSTSTDCCVYSFVHNYVKYKLRDLKWKLDILPGKRKRPSKQIPKVSYWVCMSISQWPAVYISDQSPLYLYCNCICNSIVSDPPSLHAIWCREIRLFQFGCKFVNNSLLMVLVFLRYQIRPMVYVPTCNYTTGKIKENTDTFILVIC